MDRYAEKRGWWHITLEDGKGGNVHREYEKRVILTEKAKGLLKYTC